MKKPWDRGGLRTYLVLLGLLFGRPEQAATLWGVPLLLAGLALQVYAKGCLQQDRVVAQGGPYRFVRHPFYAGNLLIDEGIAVMSGWVPLMLALPLWWLAVYIPVMRGEERHLSGLFPSVYPAYRGRVSMLAPLRRPLPKTEGGFSWRNANIVSDTVVPRVLRLAVLPLLFVLARALRADGVHLFQDDNGVRPLVAAMLLSACGVSWELRRHLRNRERILPPGAAGVGFRLAVAAVVLAVAGLVHAWEMESVSLTALAGVMIVAASVAFYKWRGAARLAAEGIALTATVVLCEMPWLAALVIPLYAAMVLDSRVAGYAAVPVQQRWSGLVMLLHARAYEFILVGGLAVALVKEKLT